MHEPRTLLLHLGLSPAETEILLAFLHGTKRVADIIKHTQIKRPTVYYAIQRLEERGLLHKTGKEKEHRLEVDLERIAALAAERSKATEENQQALNQWVKTLQLSTQHSDEPRVSFYQGITSVTRTIMETLYTKDKKIYTIAPTKNFFGEMGEKFKSDYITQRNQRGIQIKSLWESPVEAKIIKTYYVNVADIRILPASMKNVFETTAFIYDDKVLYISSKKQAYALLVASKEQNRFMRAVFEGLWSASKPHP